MQYILLLRSVNLGKLRKVSMPELKRRLAALGYENVTSYINSGNLLFVSSRDKTTVANSSDGATAVQCVVHADLAAHPVEL
mgnify:CR=1 FL=1